VRRRSSCREGRPDRRPCELSEFSFALRLFLKSYPWRRIEPVPWCRPSKPLARARVGLVTTAGFVGPHDPPFDDAVRGGDSSFRVLRADASLSSLREHHRSESFDHEGIASDPNLAFPLDRLKELAERGRIGSVSLRHLSFMGSITAPGRLLRDTLPEAARIFEEDEVDVALLVPV
jgi:D-proline reductase (dithiol) PrdB